MNLQQLSQQELIQQIQSELGDVDVAQLLNAWKESPPSENERALLQARGQECRAAGVSEEGYKHLYWCLTKREYSDAHLRLLRGLLKAYHSPAGRGVMIQAWRGFGKSTDLLVWVLLLLGNHPEKSMAFIRINDTKAQEAGDAIAGIIETSVSWRACFPNVVPDEKAGWSKKAGFFVQNKDIVERDGYSKWREICFADHISEPSLTCAGIESGLIIGLHPTNGEWFDDLHDRKNTRSATEMQNIVDMFTDNVLPAWFSPTGMPNVAVVCTPWDSDNDVYAAMLKTGLFDLVKIPIFDFDDNSPTYFAPLRKNVRLAWPEKYPIEVVLAIFKAADVTPRLFWQMFLLDDRAARENTQYKYTSFRADLIDWNLPMVGGVDPVYTDRKEGAVSHFALCYGVKLPTGGVVVADGVLEKTSASQGMDYVVRAQNMFTNYMRTWCEVPGGNILFIQMVQHNPGIRISPIESKELGSDKKGDRQYSFLQPLLASGYVYISDAQTPFLNCLRNYLMKYPNITDEHAPEWDVADALVAMLFGCPDVRLKAVQVASEAAMQKQIARAHGKEESFGRSRKRIAWNNW